MTEHNIDGKRLFIVDNLLTSEEADYFIKFIESQELHTVDSGFALYDRHIMVSKEWADKIYKRIIQFFPEELYKKSLSINDHFRFSKYHPGGYFYMHRDGVNVADGKKSFTTVNIFLNSEFESGETSFFTDSSELVIKVKPVTGRAAIFDRNIYHTGNTVLKGVKYLMRTDIMI